MKIRFIVAPEYDGRELRSVLENHCQMSHALIKKIKLYGILEVNGVHRRVIDQVKAGEEVYASYDDDCGDCKRDTGINIYYEDEHLVVCEKPNNLVTHPTHNHLDDSLTTRLSDVPMHPVMRLDRETTGIICIAKNGYAHDLVQKNKMNKTAGTSYIKNKFATLLSKMVTDAKLGYNEITDKLIENSFLSAKLKDYYQKFYKTRINSFLKAR